MFTGIITDIGKIVAIASKDKTSKLTIATNYSDLTIGNSIACDGICLTITDHDRNEGSNDYRSWFTCDVSSETLVRTTAVAWGKGKMLNLEQALKLGDELGGHIVTGHVDSVAEVTRVEVTGDYQRFEFMTPAGSSHLIADKGSIAVDGVSLTVNHVHDNRFTVMIIPHTMSNTTLSGLKSGSRVNIETDMIARHIARLMAPYTTIN